MPIEQIDEGTYRISGAFGSAFYVPNTPDAQPIKIIEATAVEFTTEIGTTDVPIPGSQDVGTKDSGVSRSGSMTVQKIDTFWENLVAKFLTATVPERRALRDAGQRLPRTFMMQLFLDDPDALGAEGWQLEGVRTNRLMGGFNRGDEITTREYPFRFRRERKIKAFERVGNELDQYGMPKIVYTDNL